MTKTNGYKRVERNISKFGNKYRVKVGKVQIYTGTRDSARVIKRNLLIKP